MTTSRSLIALAIASLLVVGCGKKDEATAPAEKSAAPAVAMQSAASASSALDAQVKAFRNNDLRALLGSLMPPKELERMRSEWEEKRKEEISAEQEQEFAENMGKLLAADGVEQIMADIEPQLNEMRPQLPGLITMMHGMATMGIAQNESLTAEQKTQATQFMNGLGGWLQKTDFADAATMRKALTALAEGMRATGISSLEDMRALSFDELLARGGPALGGVKGALQAYGFSLDEIADSVQSEVVSESGDSAKLKVSYALFGTPLSFESDMRKLDGRWYSKDVIEQAEKSAQDAAASAQP